MKRYIMLVLFVAVVAAIIINVVGSVLYVRTFTTLLASIFVVGALTCSLIAIIEDLKRSS